MIDIGATKRCGRKHAMTMMQSIKLQIQNKNTHITNNKKIYAKKNVEHKID